MLKAQMLNVWFLWTAFLARSRLHGLLNLSQHHLTAGQAAQIDESIYRSLSPPGNLQPTHKYISRGFQTFIQPTDSSDGSGYNSRFLLFLSVNWISPLTTGGIHSQTLLPYVRQPKNVA